jgi:FkbM family methyltransferase
MTLPVSLKHLTLRLLPDVLLQHVRAKHYARKLVRAPAEPEMAVIPHLLSVGGYALDLGANFGAYTHFLARTVGPAGQVHAVEPIPESFKVLRSNVRRTRLSAVSVYNLAVSDATGSATMSVPHYEHGGENLYEARVVNVEYDLGVRSVQVATERLDELFGRLGRIDFIKCDVEGHELNVLRGATEILRVHRPAWLIEVSGNPDDPESKAAEVVNLMSRANYRVFHLEAGQPRPRSIGDRAVNYFFLRPEHVRRLKAAS